MNPNKTAELIDSINARLTESATLSRISFIDLMSAGNDCSAQIHDIYEAIKSIADTMASEDDKQEIGKILLKISMAMVVYHEKADALWYKIEADNAKTTELRNKVAEAMGGGL
jgi:hypothetical protein